MRIILLSILFISFSSSFAEADEKYFKCPLTSNLMMEDLVSVKTKLESGNYEISKSEKNYFDRMSGEVLKNKVFNDLYKDVKSENKLCNYFRISVYLEDVSSENMDFRKESISKVLTGVEKCINWFNSRFAINNKIIESYYCK
ncbi:hypothetical protein KA005_70375 [bacterium]|nr:hypothetical protein [bacterium]